MRSPVGAMARIALALLLVPHAVVAQAEPGSFAGVFRRATLELALDPDGGYRLSEESATLAQGRLQGRLQQPDTLAAVDVSGPGACQPADTGRYLIRSSPDSLWLVALRDPCHRRSDALAGGWRRLVGATSSPSPMRPSSTAPGRPPGRIRPLSFGAAPSPRCSRRP
jgi:hypothetical protein